MAQLEDCTAYFIDASSLNGGIKEEEAREAPEAESEDRTHRMFYILKTKSVFEHGATPGCQGCAGVIATGREGAHQCVRQQVQRHPCQQRRC